MLLNTWWYRESHLPGSSLSWMRQALGALHHRVDGQVPVLRERAMLPIMVHLLSVRTDKFMTPALALTHYPPCAATAATTAPG